MGLEYLSKDIVLEKDKIIGKKFEDTSPNQFGNVLIVDVGIKGNSSYIIFNVDDGRRFCFFEEYIRYLRII
ncbi:MAG TPA: hypothetical protein VJH65_03830 [Candidatus Nanoarchaeia archaeon]|nr:hypothetical protein [Candidatus Nanoarchaeia archaeon]